MDSVIKYFKENPNKYSVAMTDGLRKDIFNVIYPDKDNLVGKYDNVFRKYPEYNRHALIMGGRRFVAGIQIGTKELKEIRKIIEDYKEEKTPTTKVKKQEWEKDFIIIEPDRWHDYYQVGLKKSKKLFGNKFNTKEEAVTFAQRLYEATQETKQQKKNFERDYVERRENNKNITPEELKDTFGFRGVNFGNWVNQKERQDFINYTYDSLFDLAELLNLPPKALSLEGQLGIAFGAQGRGGKGAGAGHYIPAYKEINLTKENGAGTLAHEWFHALDNYFGDKSANKEYSGFFSLELSSKGELREELYNALKDVYKAIKETPFTAEDVAKNIESLTKRINYNIKRYADYIKVDYKRAKNAEELNKIVDDLVENAEKYKTYSYEEMHEIENKFFSLLPEIRDTITNRGKFSWLTSELRKLARVEELAQTGAKKSEFLVNAERLNTNNPEMGVGYWSKTHEMGARAFTTYLLDRMEKQSIKNLFLSRNQDGEVSLDLDKFARKLSGEEVEGEIFIHWNPTNPEEKARIFKAFDKLFETIKTKETDKGIELYSLDDKEKIYKISQEVLNNSDNVSKYWNYKTEDFNTLIENLGITDVIDDVNNFALIFADKLGLTSDIQKLIEKNAKELQISSFKSNNKTYGKFGDNTIKINKAIADKLPVFSMTVSHEYWHSIQHLFKKEILNIPEEQRTQEQIEFLKDMEESENYYNEVKDYLKKYPNVKKILNNLSKMNENKAIKYYNKLNQIDKKRCDYFVKEIRPKYYELNAENQSFEVGNYIARSYDYGKRRTTIVYKRTSKPNLSSNNISRYFGWDRLRRGRRRARSNTEEELSENNYPISDEIDYSKYNKVVKNYIREWYSDIEKDRYDVNKTLNSFINMTKAIAKEYSNKFGMKINDKQVREILPFLRERTELPKNLERTDLEKFFNKLSGADKERLTKLADDTSKKFEKYYLEYQEAKGVEDVQSIENHISHIWDLDKKQKSLLTNYFATSSRFAKNRTIDTLVKGIDGFEVNGETIYFKPKTLDYAEILKTSSDSFIKAKSDMILADRVKELGIRKGNKINRLVLPTNKAPSDWVEFDHPALNKVVYMGGNEDVTILGKRPVKVHPDIAKSLKTVFETPATRNEFLYNFDRLNALYKQSQLGFSGFHMVALSESMLGNIGVKETVKLLNPKRMYDEIANGNWGIYKDDTISKQAIEDGLQLGATLDLDRGTVEKLADDIVDYVEKLPVVGKYLKYIPKTLGKAQRLNNQILWDYLHNNYKLECYKLYVTQQAEKLGRALTTPERREIAQWVNDSFGGQVWENLGISPSQRRVEQRLLLSPDWLRSTTRQFLAMFSTEKGSKFLNEKAKENDFWKQAKEIAEEWGINSNTESIGASNLRGRLSRAFWLRALIYSAILYNMMNAFFREKDRQENPKYYPKNMTIKDYSLVGNSKGSKTFVFVGRNSDGTERYLRLGKQFREMPEMIEKPLEKLGGKASPLLQIGSQILTGNTASGFKNRNFYDKKGNLKKGWDRVGESAKLLGTSFAPYSMNSLFNPYMDTTAWSLFAPVGKGMTKGKGKTAFVEAYKTGKKEDLEEIRQSLVRNGFDKKDIKKIESSSRSEFLKPYKERYIEALEEKDKNEVLKISKELEKTSISPSDRQKIYQKALKEYLK
jgi:hypothetical protein